MNRSLHHRLAGLALACAAVFAPSAHADELDDVRSALAAGASEVAAWVDVDVSSMHDGWTPTGLTVEEGQHLTVFGRGAIALSETAPPLRPAQFIWVRVGGKGPLVAWPTDEYSFAAPHSGEVEIAIKPVAPYWSEPDGGIPGGFESLPDLPIDVGATIASWRGDPAAGLAALSQNPDDAFARAGRNLADMTELPPGIEHLWFARRHNLFAAWSDGTHTGVRGLPTTSAGVVERRVDIPLTDDTEFSFEWVYDQLPALGPETEAQYHDYLSIALEFDNGRDLTWMRSAHLEAEQSFHCPLPGWENRETHFVIESGEAGLGEWTAHTRNVADDYRSAIGGQLPSRIVSVWFINVGLFGGHDGDARFANAAIVSGGERTEIFAAE